MHLVDAIQIDWCSITYWMPRISNTQDALCTDDFCLIWGHQPVRNNEALEVAALPP